MFEKEAEEFVDSKKSFWRQGRTCIDSVRQTYQKGVEFGYNKANEWHFVKDESYTKSWKKYNKYLVIIRLPVEVGIVVYIG